MLPNRKEKAWLESWAKHSQKNDLMQGLNANPWAGFQCFGGHWAFLQDWCEYGWRMLGVPSSSCEIRPAHNTQTHNPLLNVCEKLGPDLDL